MEGRIRQPSSNLCLGKEAITEVEREPRKCALKASMSSSSVKSLELIVQNANHAHEESSNTRIQEGDQESDKLVTTHLIKPIEQGLIVLEEEDEVLKESVLRSMEERTVLMNEIRTRFQAIHNHLRLTNQETENMYFDEVLVSTQALKKERRPGLLQVLWQESSPPLITRYVKARAVPEQSLHMTTRVHNQFA